MSAAAIVVRELWGLAGPDANMQPDPTETPDVPELAAHAGVMVEELYDG